MRRPLPYNLHFSNNRPRIRYNNPLHSFPRQRKSTLLPQLRMPHERSRPYISPQLHPVHPQHSTHTYQRPRHISPYLPRHIRHTIPIRNIGISTLDKLYILRPTLLSLTGSTAFPPTIHRTQRAMRPTLTRHRICLNTMVWLSQHTGRTPVTRCITRLRLPVSIPLPILPRYMAVRPIMECHTIRRHASIPVRECHRLNPLILC